MKQLFIVCFSLIMVACGGNAPEAEYPEAEYQPEETTSVAEDDSERAEEPAEEPAADQGDHRVLPPGQIEEKEEQDSENEQPTPAEFAGLGVMVPAGWEVRDASPGALQLFNPRTKAYMKAWVGDDSLSRAAYTEQLRQETIKNFDATTSGVAPDGNWLNFSYLAKNGKTGVLKVASYNLAFGNIVVCVFSSSERRYFDSSTKAVDALIDSINLEAD